MNALKMKAVKSITLLFLLAIFALIMIGCQSSQNDLRSDDLLGNLISENEDGFVFEQIVWGTTKQELIEENHIPEGATDGDAESLILDDKIKFKNPKSTATVIYQFQDDLFIGGEYHIETGNVDDLVLIAGKLKDQLSKDVGEPDSNTLDELSEESIRRGSNGVAYLDDGNGSLEVLFPENIDSTLTIKIRGPREVLEKILLEKTK